MNSKRFNFTILLIICFICSDKVIAQNNNFIGINTGATYADFRGNNELERYGSSINYLFGISGIIEISHNLRIVGNLNFEKKSVSRNYSTSELPLGGCINCSSDKKIKDEFIFDYISVPLMLRYTFGYKNEIFINVGGYYNWLTRIKYKYGGTLISFDGLPIEPFDFSNSFEKTDFGCVFGLGYEFSLSKKDSLFIELRNNYGIKKINNESNTIFDFTKTNSLNLILNWSLSM